MVSLFLCVTLSFNSYFSLLLQSGNVRAHSVLSLEEQVCQEKCKFTCKKHTREHYMRVGAGGGGGGGGESTHLPAMCMWVECPYSKDFCLASPVYLPQPKLPNSNSTWNAQTPLKPVPRELFDVLWLNKSHLLLLLFEHKNCNVITIVLQCYHSHRKSSTVVFQLTQYYESRNNLQHYCNSIAKVHVFQLSQ